MYYVVLSLSSHKLFDSAPPFAIFAFSAAKTHCNRATTTSEEIVVETGNNINNW